MAAAAQARRLASPAVRTLVRRRLSELGGLVLGLVALALLVALVSYDARDPSLNTATGRAAGNLAGPAGAALADVLLQGFGVAGALPGLAMLAWAWRLASHRGLGSDGGAPGRDPGGTPGGGRRARRLADGRGGASLGQPRPVSAALSEACLAAARPGGGT